MANPFKWRHYQSDIILLTVRWYLRYALSYRDLEEMMAERGLSLDHTTIYRWVQRYAPELDKRCRPYLKQTNDSWRVDETDVKVNARLRSGGPISRGIDQSTAAPLSGTVIKPSLLLAISGTSSVATPPA